MSRAPMFVLEFENPLFEFAYDKPHCDPLFAFPPTFRSSTPSAIRRYSPWRETTPSGLIATHMLRSYKWTFDLRLFFFFNVDVKMSKNNFSLVAYLFGITPLCNGRVNNIFYF